MKWYVRCACDWCFAHGVADNFRDVQGFHKKKNIGVASEGRPVRWI